MDVHGDDFCPSSSTSFPGAAFSLLYRTYSRWLGGASLQKRKKASTRKRQVAVAVNMVFVASSSAAASASSLQSPCFTATREGQIVSEELEAMCNRRIDLTCPSLPSDGPEEWKMTPRPLPVPFRVLQLWHARVPCLPNMILACRSGLCRSRKILQAQAGRHLPPRRSKLKACAAQEHYCSCRGPATPPTPPPRPDVSPNV